MMTQLEKEATVEPKFKQMSLCFNIWATQLFHCSDATNIPVTLLYKWSQGNQLQENSLSCCLFLNYIFILLTKIEYFSYKWPCKQPACTTQINERLDVFKRELNENQTYHISQYLIHNGELACFGRNYKSWKVYKGLEKHRLPSRWLVFEGRPLQQLETCSGPQNYS